MAQEPSSAQFLAPELSTLVGQVLSVAARMGVTLQIAGTQADISIWSRGAGFGNPGALYNAADSWSSIANQIQSALTELNIGANTALGRGPVAQSPTAGGLPPASNGEVWKGESATNFTDYVGDTLNPALAGLQQDAGTVATAMGEAAYSCYVMWLAIASTALSILTGGATAAAGGALLGIAAGLAVQFVGTLIGKITDSLDKFQQAKSDIVKGRTVPAGVLATGQFPLPGGGYTPSGEIL